MMTVSLLQFSDLRITIQPESLGFSDTAELLQQPTGWIGQERAEAAARYGLLVKQPGYHLFVLGEHGSGRCSLLQQLLIEMAANQPIPPDLCVLHRGCAENKSIVLYLPAGQGCTFQSAFWRMTKSLPASILAYFGDDVSAIQWNAIKALADTAFSEIQSALQLAQGEQLRLSTFFEQMQAEIVACLSTLQHKQSGKSDWWVGLNNVLSAHRINLIVDNAELSGAPVIIEQNSTVASLLGYVDYPSVERKPQSSLPRVTAGSLLKANGGFIMLHVSDLLENDALWIKLRHFLRSQKISLEGHASLSFPYAPVFPESQLFDADVKIVLIGSRDEYYGLQEDEAEFMQHFRVKVDFHKSFQATQPIYQASSVLVAKICHEAQLPHFSAAAVARLLEESHRTVEHQKYLSAVFADTKVLMIESAGQCSARHGSLVEVSDIEAALHARDLRHNGPELQIQQSILDGEILVALSGAQVGRLNALTQIEWGECRFGTTACITARTFPGEDGLLNIVREVDMSGPIHDKGVLILQSYLSALFAHIAPLALSASVVFEQEYAGIEGDSATCAEFYVLLSSLANTPLKQGIAVTGAMNQYGEVLPIGAINDKIEGYFRLCVKAGLTGEQGVLIPQANRQHLVLHPDVVAAVKADVFTIHTMEHVMQGLELLSELPSGMSESGRVAGYPLDTMLGHVQRSLVAFRRACQMTQHGHKAEYRRFPSRTEK